MAYFLALQTATNTSASNSIAYNNFSRSGVLLVQIDFGSGAAGTVTINGRIDPTHEWIAITSKTADALEAIVFCPFIQVVTTSITGGTVTIGIFDS